MSSGGKSAPDYPQMTDQERQLQWEQSQMLRQSRDMYGQQWEQQQRLQPGDERNYLLQQQMQNDQLNAMRAMTPQINQYNSGAMNAQLKQQELQQQLMAQQQAYAPQQYQTAQQLLGLQQGAMNNYNALTPGLMNETYQAGRGATDLAIHPAEYQNANLPTETADYNWQQAFIPERTQQQLDLTRGYYDRTMNALNGNLPVDPAMERNIQEQQQSMRAQMEKQLGPGWETSSAGMEAAQNFAKRAEELRYTQRNNMLQQAGQMYNQQSATNMAQSQGMQNLLLGRGQANQQNMQTALGNQQLSLGQQQGMAANLANRGAELANATNRQNSLMSLIGQPFGYQMSQPSLMNAGQLSGMMNPVGNFSSGSYGKLDPGAYAQLAQGYGSMMQPYQQQRQGQYNSAMQGYQGSQGGSSLASILGGLGGTLAGSFLGPFGGAVGGMAGSYLGNSMFGGGSRGWYGSGSMPW